MKTTSFLISKQLAEAGFDYDYDCGYTSRGKLIDTQEQMGAYYIKTPSFCLETLLEALPKKIQNKEKDYHFWITYSGSSDCWIMGYIWGIQRNLNFEEYNEGIESLADTAAKLWLKLKKENLI